MLSIYCSLSSSAIAAKLRGVKACHVSNEIKLAGIMTHITSGHVMLAVGFNPVETQSVQESRKTLHDTKDRNGEEEPHGEHDEDEDGADDAVALVQEGVVDGHGVQHFGQLRVSQRQRPQSKVGCAGHQHDAL